MNPDRKAPTLSDVAKSSGVSLYTVSVVLNGARSNTRVSEATRKRILETAKHLRYHPNAMARGLVHGRMQSIGVLFGIKGSSADYITNSYASAVLQGALTACTAADCCVTLFTQNWLDAPRSAPRFRDGRTDGILVIAPRLDSDIVSGLSSLFLPLSVVSYPGEPYGVPSVDVDNEVGVRLAVEHLFSLGHRRITHLMGNQDLASGPMRLTAFQNALAERGIADRPENTVQCAYNGDLVDEAVRYLFTLPEPPTALFAGNDTIAIAAMNAARSLDIRVPEQLSIVGFDDAPIASVPTPALTTIRQPFLEIGETATRLLLAQIDGENVSATPRFLAPELIIRGSTAPAP